MNRTLVFATITVALMFEMITPTEIPGGQNILPHWNVRQEIVVLKDRERKRQLAQLHEFMEAVGLMESDNRYNVENRFGMLGKYQFSPTTIEYLGFDVTKDEFLSDRNLQDEVMMVYLSSNYRELYDYIMEYDGQTFKGVTLNTASMLAGAHFAGATGLKRFINNMADSVGVVDGNGMSLKKYMTRFSSFTLDMDL